MKGNFPASGLLGLSCVILAAAACAGSAQPPPTQPGEPQPPQAQPPQAQPPQAQPPQAQPPQAQPPQAQPPQAQPPAAPSAQGIGVTGPACVIKGASPVAKDTQLFDSPSGGRVIATFTGNFVPMQLRDIPADPVSNRAKLATSTGSGSLRLEGYVQASSVSVFSARDIPVAAGNVWIASAQKLRLVAAAAGSVTVELAAAGARSQTVRATAACEALALQRGTPVPMEIPGNGRGYLTKGSTVELHNRANGDVVFSLQLVGGTSHLFWSTETQSGFVHVRSRADLAIDAWIRSSSLDPLKQGEMMDQYIPPESQVTGAQLAMDKPPRMLTASKDLPVRARRDEKEKPIGVVETGAEVYVMETVAGWTNVLPRSLYVVPPEDGGFWIPSGEVPR